MSEQPHFDATKITDDLVAPIFRLPSIHWLGGFLTAAGISGALFTAVLVYVIGGYGVFGVNNVVNWGNDIGTYIYWIAVAVAIVVLVAKPSTAWIAAPFVVLWLLSPVVARWVSLPSRAGVSHLSFCSGVPKTCNASPTMLTNE